MDIFGYVLLVLTFVVPPAAVMVFILIALRIENAASAYPETGKISELEVEEVANAWKRRHLNVIKEDILRPQTPACRYKTAAAPVLIRLSGALIRRSMN